MEKGGVMDASAEQLRGEFGSSIGYENVRMEKN
jgi:hypothetical protein